MTFGHPYGAQLSTGVWKRQPDSEYQFIVSHGNLFKSLSTVCKLMIGYY